MNYEKIADDIEEERLREGTLPQEDLCLATAILVRAFKKSQTTTGWNVWLKFGLQAAIHGLEWYQKKSCGRSMTSPST